MVEASNRVLQALFSGEVFPMLWRLTAVLNQPGYHSVRMHPGFKHGWVCRVCPTWGQVATWNSSEIENNSFAKQVPTISTPCLRAVASCFTTSASWIWRVCETAKPAPTAHLTWAPETLPLNHPTMARSERVHHNNIWPFDNLVHQCTPFVHWWQYLTSFHGQVGPGLNNVVADDVAQHEHYGDAIMPLVAQRRPSSKRASTIDMASIFAWFLV